MTYEPSIHYSRESNGKAERLNRTMSQMVRGSLVSSGLQENLAGEAFNMAVYVKN